MSPSAPPTVRRHFLPWDAPLLPQAVAWLAEDWTGTVPLDLSRTLVVVPTRQAGRRLRAGLAAHAAERGQAVFPPRVLTPESLVAPAPTAPVASPLLSQLAWAHVLDRQDLEACRAVFPVDPPERGTAWAWRLAGEFTRLQATLAEAGLAFADVSPRAPEGFPEHERWQQLARLEQLHARELARTGHQPPQAARLAAATEPAAWPDTDRLVLLAVPDPLPLALAAVAAHARTHPVTVVIHAPAAESAAFDDWGRPRAEAWRHRVLDLGPLAEVVHLLPDATAQAEEIARLAARYAAPDGMLGVGVADPEIVPLTENALARSGLTGFNPAGAPRARSGFHHLLARVAAFAREPSFGHLAALARTPEVLDWLRAEIGPGFSAARWLQELDDLWNRHLPATLALAREVAHGAAAVGLDKFADLHAQLQRGGFAESVAAVLARLHAARPLDLRRPEDAELAGSAAAWNDTLRECAAGARCFPGLPRETWWEIALAHFGAQMREDDKPAGAIELQGWLELPWEDAPHLVVAGCNEGFVPDAIAGDLFLPESLRVALGLKSNDERLARDACLLQALCASRRRSGRVDLLLGKVSAAGDPLKPSRLLLRCEDAELPARVEHLFRPLEAVAALPAWERPWRLQPCRAAVPERISVTALRGYLECPFRFYLRHVLRMREVDPEKTELDAFDFGALCHAPLERLAEEPWRDCTDAAALAGMLLETFDRIARAQFGAEVTVPVVAQLESARQRLRRAAEVQAQERAAGWVVVAVEKKFALPSGGVVLSGKIDRIDRHEKTGAWRVLDYKTTDTAHAPEDTHLAAPRREGGQESWALCEHAGRARAWSDLQLPLYVAALTLPDLLPGVPAGTRASCGYFNLPKAVGDTAVTLWDGYTPDLHASALRCVEGIVAAVRAGKFWPPNERIPSDRDEFAGLFHRGVAASVVEVGP